MAMTKNGVLFKRANHQVQMFLRIIGEVLRNHIQPLVATEGSCLVLGRRMKKSSMPKSSSNVIKCFGNHREDTGVKPSQESEML